MRLLNGWLRCDSLKVVESRLNETSEGRDLLDTVAPISLEGIFNIKVI